MGFCVAAAGSAPLLRLVRSRQLGWTYDATGLHKRRSCLPKDQTSAEAARRRWLEAKRSRVDQVASSARPATSPRHNFVALRI